MKAKELLLDVLTMTKKERMENIVQDSNIS